MSSEKKHKNNHIFLQYTAFKWVSVTWCLDPIRHIAEVLIKTLSCCQMTLLYTDNNIFHNKKKALCSLCSTENTPLNNQSPNITFLYNHSFWGCWKSIVTKLAMLHFKYSYRNGWLKKYFFSAYGYSNLLKAVGQLKSSLGKEL